MREMAIFSTVIGFMPTSLLIACGEMLFNKRAAAALHAMTRVRGSHVRRRRARSLPLPLGCGSFRLGS
jgi:hypothetical protein